jgi:hypothetical protein
MATVRHLENLSLDRESKQTETTCTYSIIHQDDGVYLQVDTYGSRDRKEPGMKSQTIRFAPETIQELKVILGTYFSEV